MGKILMFYLEFGSQEVCMKTKRLSLYFEDKESAAKTTNTRKYL